MLQHKKKDQSFISVPVSRVGSSLRLNQLAAQNSAGAYKSIPSTPSGYVSSSLRPKTPTTGSRSQISSKEQLAAFEKLPVVEHVKAFEGALTDLSNSISSFKEDQITDSVEALIHHSDHISAELRSLQRHQQLGHKIDSLESENRALEDKSKHILKELISLRGELKLLPRLPSRNDTTKNTNDVNIEEALKYAMKLAKFTKAPATAANAQFQIHPNNYIWPAEDALRRGVLALCSLKPDEILKQELGDVPVAVDVDVEEPVQEKEPELERRPSAGEASIKQKRPVEIEQPQIPAPSLDLDLFDPDADSDSD